MKGSRMYDMLQADHVELGRIVTDLAERTGHEELTDAEGLSRCRWQLVRLLTRHLALEDDHVYAPLNADQRPEAREISRRFKDDIGGLHAAFAAHCARWTADAVVADWPGYRAAAGIIIRALVRRIEWEDAELYPMLKRVQLDRAA